jgi:hypothetical protein
MSVNGDPRDPRDPHDPGEPLDPSDPRDPAPDPRVRTRRRTGLWIRLGLVLLLVVLITIVHRSSSKSTTLPAGRWGQTIACLERNQTERITDTRTGAVPTSRTTTVTVTRIQRNVTLAEVRDAGSAATARAIVAHNRFDELSRADYRTAGATVWAFVANAGDPPKISANSGERQLIDFCAEHPGRR